MSSRLNKERLRDALVVGVAFLRRPGPGAAALTLLLGTALLIGRVARIVASVGERRESCGWITANGVITLLLELLILFGWRGSTLWVLGTFLGVDLVVEGVTFIVLGSIRRERLLDMASRASMSREGLRTRRTRAEIRGGTHETSRWVGLSASGGRQTQLAGGARPP